MKYRVFKSFREASTYAREAAERHSCTVAIKRQGESFAVRDFQAIDDDFDKLARDLDQFGRSSLLDWWEQREEEKRKAEQLKRQREYESKRTEENRKRFEARKPYLEEKEKEYRDMEDSALEKAWANRDASNLEQDEKRMLLSILRKRKGIEPGY